MPEYKNRFLEGEYYEHTIVNDVDRSVVGTIRVKPSSVLWKPKGGRKFYSVSLERLGDWMCDNGRRVAK